MGFNLPIKVSKTILALGSEFDTRLAFYCRGKVEFSENIENLADQPDELEKFVLDFLQFVVGTRHGASLPDIIITDLHPLYKSIQIGEKIAKRFKAKHILVQHHIAHIFTAIGDWMMEDLPLPPPSKGGELNDIYGIACDGTGYGFDGNIWGGEVFKIGFSKGWSPEDGCIGESHLPLTPSSERRGAERVGHLEEQYLIGGELAVEQPARMLLGVLSKFLSKDEVFKYVKKYYSENEFELLYNQLEQKFNCPLTTSTGRVLDAVSLLLGFCKNERKYKHYAVKMLEENSRSAGIGKMLKPEIAMTESGEYILKTTHLFKYLVEQNGRMDSNALAAISQRYIIEGLSEIVKVDYRIPLNPPLIKGERNVFFSGGLADNKIMKTYAEKNNIYVAREIPSGDKGIALGQLTYYLLSR